MDLKELEILGLTRGEIKVYSAILHIGSSSINNIHEKTGMERRAIYDIINKLIEKGLISYTTERGKRTYQCAPISRIREEIKNKKEELEKFEKTIPQIEEIYKSKKQKMNIDKLLDTLLLVSDIHENAIKADPDRAAAGTVIEAHVDKGEGPVATILVQTGTLRANDPLVVNGEIYGKVRAMRNYRGENIPSAPPSCPVRVLGFKVAPQVGDVMDVSKFGSSEKIDVKYKRSQQSGAERHVANVAQNQDENDAKKILNVVIKADTLGSLEAIIASLEKIKNEEAEVCVVGKGLGNITADDVASADTAKALLIAFSVFTTPVAQEMIQNTGVRFSLYRVIYDLLDFIKEELEKTLNPTVTVIELGNFKVIQIFRSDKKMMILGGRVESGKLEKDAKVRVKREGNIVGYGKLTKLQSSKQEVNEIPQGTEGGVQFEGKVKVEEGDVLEAYKEETKAKKLVLN